MTFFWLTLAALVVLNVAAIPYFLFLFMTAVAAILAPSAATELSEPQSRFLIVIPAHNEEAGITTTIRSCLARTIPGRSSAWRSLPTTAPIARPHWRHPRACGWSSGLTP